MTPSAMELILRKITYKPGWAVRFHNDIGDRPYLQIEVTAPAIAAVNAVSGVAMPWTGAKVYLSPHMCKQEIVGAAFKAFRDAELHELHEWFRYAGAAIYGPHIDPDALVAVADRIEMRR